MHSDDHTIITPLYGHLDEAEAILADSWTKGQRQYLVQWKPTPCRDRHIKLHEARGYEVADITQFCGDDRIHFDEEASLIFWKPKWECAENFTHPSNPSQTRMAEAFEEEKASRPALKLTAATSRRQDTGRTNLDRQGQWVPEEFRPERTLWYRPGLRKHIHIDPDNTINPDHDIVPTGQYTIGLKSCQGTTTPPGAQLVNVYNDEGKIVGTMTAKRLGILKAAFHHMQNKEPEVLSELGATCFEHEVARLMDRYKTPDAEALLKAQKQRQVTPDEYMHAFKVGFGIQCERFA